jgi:uncharacterized protein YvpB
MRRRVPEIIGASICLLLVAGIVVSWVGYGSRPDVAFHRFWNRLVAAASRPKAAGTILPVAFDAQDHALSCEIAALKMALAAKGVAVPESELLQAVGFDLTGKRQEAGRIVWGDPQQGFVGDIDGRMPETGYGVHWKPIARAAEEWRDARAVDGMTPEELAEELADGNPVVVWVYLGSGTPYEWQTPGGRTVHAVLNEHTFTAYGFTGGTEAPSGFYLMDPIYGARYWDTGKLFDRMEKLGYGAVIIR